MALGGCFLVKLLVLCLVSGFTSSWGSIATSSSGPWRSCRCHPSFSLSCSHGPCRDSVGDMSGPVSAMSYLKCLVVGVSCGDLTQNHIFGCLVFCGKAEQTWCHTFSCHWWGFGLASAISLQQVRLCQYVSWEVLSLILAKFGAVSQIVPVYTVQGE